MTAKNYLVEKGYETSINVHQDSGFHTLFTHNDMIIFAEEYAKYCTDKLTDETVSIMKVCEEINEINEIDWKELRDYYFKECVAVQRIPIIKELAIKGWTNKSVINFSPHNLFEWFKSKTSYK